MIDILFILLFVALSISMVMLVLVRAYYLGYFSFKPSITSSDRGTSSERRLINILLNHNYKRTAIYHDLYVGNMSQIDAVLCTDIGLIVIEVKDYIGWIFGNGYDDKWTQISGYGANKYRFYNPVLQNIGHIHALQKIDALRDIPMYSLVVFFGDCEFKEIYNIPEDTKIAYGSTCVDAIEAFKRAKPVYAYGDKWAVANALRELMDAGKDPKRRLEQQQNVQRYVMQNGLSDDVNYASGFSWSRTFRYFTRSRFNRSYSFHPRLRR